MRILIFLVFLTLGQSATGGGIRGVIKGEDGGVLAYATIYVRQTSTGSASDTEGRYEVSLRPGTYDIIYQFLGYESVTRKVEVREEFVEINITLKTHTIVLQNVTIKGDEDPAYTIMRKTIAKAKYHTQQIDSYTARVYIKGRGKLLDYPWLAKKALEKEGITKDRLFIQESVSDIKYTRPNKFEEKVIAIYTTGKSDGYESPNEYVFGSFYEPEIAETISPLAPKAFSYYRFEYLGTFRDRGFDISKIKVTPRSKGDNVVEGTLYIVDDWWSIHSVDFHTTKLGVGIHVKQIYNPIEEKAWLPVSQTFKINGKVFGFEFEGEYLATVRDYKIVLNPALPLEMRVIDEKVEPVKAEEIKKAQPKKKDPKLEERLASGQEVTDKELRQLVREYEKQELKAEKEPNVIADTNFSVDSMATKKDSTFWHDIRPVALNKEEIRGYQKQDSLDEVERKKNEGDTLRKANSKNRKGFQPWDILTGDSYKLTETSNFRIHAPYGGFNTVEGAFALYRLSLYKRWVVKDSTGKKDLKTYRLEINPGVRYSFARNKVTGFLRTDLRNRNFRVTLEGGRYIQQFNAGEPIHHFVNTFSTLMWGRNYMKLYERDYIDLNYRQRINDKLTFRSNFVWASRSELQNNTTYTFFASYQDRFTPNAPASVEAPETTFETHKAFTGSIGLEARPWQKFRIRNGNKSRIDHSSPLFTIDYKKGFHSLLGSQVDFDFLEAGVRHRIKIGVRGTLDVAAQGGGFLNSSQMYFMDFKHFMGNRTTFITTDPSASFRLLDYYLYSTHGNYGQFLLHYHFRKFAVTQLPKARLLGLGESVFLAHVVTKNINYSEVGYSLEGILRVFRAEIATSFTGLDLANAKFGFRIGIASSIAIDFAD
jgi:hypothetical protein